MSAIDALIGVFSPEAALRRQRARRALAYYEAAKPGRLRKFRTAAAGPNLQTQQGAVAVRNQVRHLAQNHDITRGALRTITDNIVGPTGVGIEPQPRRPDGSIHEEYAALLREAWRDWMRHPEVTQQYHWARVQRLLARTWIRDGEAFAQLLQGPIPLLQHGTRVPLSLELFEPDMVPYYLNDTGRGIRQGIETNAWGAPRAYWLHKHHPSDNVLTSALTAELKRVPADRILHIASTDRIGQLRGVSEFASVITRLEDIKDYEESERVAAKIAAMLTAYVKRHSPDGIDPDRLARDESGNPLPREIGLEPGVIIDTLEVGEEIGLIDSKRPNPNLVTFRQGQLKAFAAGIGASYSSLSKDYSGTYSAQRQEMGEQWTHYAALTDEFVGNIIRPVWEAFVIAADLSGAVPRPADLRGGSADDASFIGQQMPWIDPAKEAGAWLKLVRAGFASEQEVIRRRGQNPADVLEQIHQWREDVAERGITFDSNAGPGPHDMEVMEAEQSRLDMTASADAGRLKATEGAEKARESEHLSRSLLAEAEARKAEADTDFTLSQKEHQDAQAARESERTRIAAEEKEARQIADLEEREARLQAIKAEAEAKAKSIEDQAKSARESMKAAERRNQEAHAALLSAQAEAREAQAAIEAERLAAARASRTAEELALEQLRNEFS